MLSKTFDPAYDTEGLFYEFVTNIDIPIMNGMKRLLPRLKLFRRLKHVQFWVVSRIPFITGSKTGWTDIMERADLEDILQSTQIACFRGLQSYNIKISLTCHANNDLYKSYRMLKGNIEHLESLARDTVFQPCEPVNRSACMPLYLRSAVCAAGFVARST